MIKLRDIWEKYKKIEIIGAGTYAKFIKLKIN